MPPSGMGARSKRVQKQRKGLLQRTEKQRGEQCHLSQMALLLPYRNLKYRLIPFQNNLSLCHQAKFHTAGISFADSGPFRSPKANFMGRCCGQLHLRWIGCFFSKEGAVAFATALFSMQKNHGQMRMPRRKAEYASKLTVFLQNPCHIIRYYRVRQGECEYDPALFATDIPLSGNIGASACAFLTL